MSDDSGQNEAPPSPTEGSTSVPLNRHGTRYGGPGRGGGRKPGQKNRRTIEQERLSEQERERLRAEGITPLEYMLKVLRTEPEPKGAAESDVDYYLRIKQSKKDRMEAAVEAAPYVHPKLAQVELKGSVGVHEDALSELE